MKRIIFYSILLVLLMHSVNAQRALQDSKSLTSLNYKVLKMRMKECSGDTICLSRYIRTYIKKARIENDSLNLAKGFKYLALKLPHKENYYDSIIHLLGSTKSEELLYQLSIAYYAKGGYEYIERNYDSSLSYYIKAKKISDGTDVNLAIALIKSRFGYYREALEIYKNTEMKYKKNSSMPYQDYLLTIFAIGEAYRHLNELDSASYYNNLGYRKASKNKSIMPYFILNEAATDYDKGNYSKSYDSLQHIIPLLEETRDISNLVAGYYFYGMSAYKLNLKEQAISYHKRVDSLTMIINDLEPEYRKSYEILIDYYHKEDDLQNQLKYIKRLLTVDSILNKKYKVLSQRLMKEYDTPKLIKEREILITSLKKQKNNYKAYLYMSFVILLPIGGYIFWSIRKQKYYKKRLDDLMEEGDISEVESFTEEIKLKKSGLDINEEVISNVIEKLQKFEEKKEYLNSNLTIHIMADNFNSNANYVSKIINHFKGISFPNYINTLRINYAINRIKNDNTFRKYTIKAIAKECGFNSSESFSKAFTKNTGIKPSYFIRSFEN